MKKLTYSAAVANDSGIFDSMDAFTNIYDALKWASGRAGKYKLHLTKVIDGVESAYIGITVKNYNGKNSYTHGFYGAISPDEIEKYMTPM